MREEEAKVTENPMSCPSAQNHTALGPSLNRKRVLGDVRSPNVEIIL